MNAITQSFADALTTYNNNAKPQAAYAKQLVTTLQKNYSRKSINAALEIGCGTGFLTHSMLDAYRINNYFVNDIVGECAEIVEHLNENINFLSGNIENLELPNNLDLICSASTFQWIEDSPKLINKIHSAMKPSGVLAISSFSTNHFKELRDTLTKANIPQKPMAYYNKNEWQSLLSTAFDIVSIEEYKQTLTFSNLRELLRHLRNTGVNGNRLKPIQPSDTRKIAKLYPIFSKQNSSVLPLSYHPIQVIARKR